MTRLFWIIHCSGGLANADGFYIEELSEFFNFASDAADADCAMVRGAVAVPAIHKLARAAGKAIPAVGVASKE